MKTAESPVKGRTIYKSYVFSEGEQSKRASNRIYYQHLLNQYKISCGFHVPEDRENIDLLIKQISEEDCSIYQILQNKTDLSLDEIALICDKGKLYFGYYNDNPNTIMIYNF